ncbi:glycoside hydrolase family 72 protein, partial [Tortispora caseinolytica NRRL Y-17796]
LNPIKVEGRNFVDSVTGERFVIKGVDYQPGGSSSVRKGNDPLADLGSCIRDAYMLQQLGINTIRVYSVDPSVNHDECMSLFAAAGIYLLLDVNTPLANQHIHRYEPWTTYTKNYLNHVFSVIEAFAGYPNTLGFFAGNEVINDYDSGQVAPAYMKAIVRDMKQYIANHIHRPIPVGYSAADDLLFRHSLPKYLSCGSEFEAIDFFGVNSYQWCGRQSMETSGYTQLLQDFNNTAVPVFFSEYGCNNVQPRVFQEVEAIYSSPMTDVFSGGLVYEYTEESNHYGLLQMVGGGALRELPDFKRLQIQLNKVKDVSFPLIQE